MVKHFLHLVRVIFPSWNFFDQLGYSFKLYFRTQPNQHWEYVDLSCQMKPVSFFFNPKANYLLAQVSVIEHFAQEVQSLKADQIQNSTLYKMIRSMVLDYLQHQKIDFNKAQFKIETVDQNQPIEIYASDWILNDDL